MSDTQAVAPEISIIVPAYQAARFVGEMLASVQEQTFPNWELILVDDGSTDETLEIVQQFAANDSRIRVLSQQNSGPSVARNTGYAATNPASKFIVFLDADDIWVKDALETLREVLYRNPEALAANGVCHYMTADGKYLRDDFTENHQRQRWGLEGGRIVAWPVEKPTTFAVEALNERIITAGTVLIRRYALELAGLWDPNLRMWEDWDLWLRVCMHGDIAFVDKLILHYRRHDSNLSNDTHEIEVGDLRIRRKLLSSLAEDKARRAIVLAGLRRQKQCMSLQFLCLAKNAWKRGERIAALKWLRRAIDYYLKYVFQKNQLSEVF